MYRFYVKSIHYTQMLHVWNIYLHDWVILVVNVGKCLYMEHMGYKREVSMILMKTSAVHGGFTYFPYIMVLFSQCFGSLYRLEMHYFGNL